MTTACNLSFHFMAEEEEEKADQKRASTCNGKERQKRAISQVLSQEEVSLVSFLAQISRSRPNHQDNEEKSLKFVAV